MPSPFRSILAALVVASAAVACADSAAPTATPQLSPSSVHPLMARIKATDSTMALTNTSFSDTSLVLKRLVALPNDIVASAVIGPNGGEIKIDAAGAKIDFPAGALSAPTLITMTAYAGLNVAYDFQPHGITFAQPVKIQQTIAGTWAQTYPQLLGSMHGSYYGTTLDSAWVDPDHYFARVQENELGYMDANASQIKFYVGHFSGYMVSCGLR